MLEMWLAAFKHSNSFNQASMGSPAAYRMGSASSTSLKTRPVRKHQKYFRNFNVYVHWVLL